MTPLLAQGLYALAWLSFAAAHSWLAGPAGRRWLWRRAGQGHRLLYNGLAVAHLGLVALVGWIVLGNATPYGWAETLAPLRWLMVLAGAGIMVLGGRQYDLKRFVGLRPDVDREPLHLDGLHRYVRHPLYSAGMVILWGLVHDPYSFATALWGSAYLVIGSRFEERRLLHLHGDTYYAYRQRVPAFLPWRGRVNL